MDDRTDQPSDRPSRAALAAFGALFLALGVAFAQTLAHAEPNARWIAAGAGVLIHARP
ncbi:MAG: hypothetical protein KF887_05745 [Paracoccaceae bacterium]|nr:MAG: hypothetical protein KF887_05745 [Paracoccaceae bacterium]